MGPRRFAATVTSPEHKTASEKFAKNLTAWIRGWDYGVVVEAVDREGVDAFEIYVAGGSNGGRSNGRRLIGTVVNGEFVRKN